MQRLAMYIEHEFDRNAIYFAQAHSRIVASCDFIDYIMHDKNIINLNEEEKKYLNRIRESYGNIASLSKEIALEIQNFKEAYEDFLASEELD